MKHIYTKTFTSFLLLIILLLVNTNRSDAQCPIGFPPGSTAYDTTIKFPTGVTSIPVKFPQFNPQGGMVTCVRLCVTITGIIDTLAMQNYAASPQTATFNYIRTDQITGPGISTPLSNSASLSYGPPGNILTAYDGTPGAGTDFYSMANDTILNEVLCRTVSDSATIIQFYGTDSVTYNYDISVSTSASISGGSSSTLVLTSALVNFHFEYCTCPGYLLPLNIYRFSVNKADDKKAALKWFGYDNNQNGAGYHYEVQMSRDGFNFQPVDNVQRNTNGNSAYSYLYEMTTTGRYFFRIRQVGEDGRSYFTDIKYVDAENNSPVKFNIYPNPSTGIVGIKFDNITAGKYVVLINNALGQTVVNKEIEVAGNSYQQVATLHKGFYWVRLTNVASQLSSVNQLFIK
ncbi:MAG: T9SS type A sorting domain-containing protein [Chitinophagaceae bacterium]|jgi:hypothetical protein|nr:T9SS type A sorting domain-containing protein [Chitinophagaceae bacterium]